jgi:hypothetical protein
MPQWLDPYGCRAWAFSQNVKVGREPLNVERLAWQKAFGRHWGTRGKFLPDAHHFFGAYSAEI